MPPGTMDLRQHCTCGHYRDDHYGAHQHCMKPGCDCNRYTWTSSPKDTGNTGANDERRKEQRHA